MKLLIASDIHGDAVCCEKMLSAAEKYNADRIVLLGDLLYHGPRNDLPENYAPKKVIELLNSVKEKLLCVRGNCDTEVDGMVLDFPIMSDISFVYDGQNSLGIYLSHGHKYSPESLPPMPLGSLFLYGHTHVYKYENKGGIHTFNPGSVSLPKQNNKKSFAVYCDGEISVLDFDGNILLTQKIV